LNVIERRQGYQENKWEDGETKQGKKIVIQTSHCCEIVFKSIDK
jgi:hypothetical protein